MLSRLALRLATLEALRPTAALAVPATLPTLAKQWVFDSRVAPIESELAALKEGQPQHYIAVYTEDDNGNSGQRPGGPPFNHFVDLCFEIGAIVAAKPLAGDDYIVGHPETDAELDAELDLLESQITFCLLWGPTGVLWRKLTGMVVTDIHSLPHRSGEERQRIAQRTVRWKTRISEDKFDPAPAAAPTGLDRLPEPLRGVLAALPGSSYGQAIAEQLGIAAPVAPVAVPLQSVGIEISADGTAQDATTFAPRVAADANDLDQV